MIWSGFVWFGLVWWPWRPWTRSRTPPRRSERADPVSSARWFNNTCSLFSSICCFKPLFVYNFIFKSSNVYLQYIQFMCNLNIHNSIKPFILNFIMFIGDDLLLSLSAITFYLSFLCIHFFCSVYRRWFSPRSHRQDDLLGGHAAARRGGVRSRGAIMPRSTTITMAMMIILLLLMIIPMIMSINMSTHINTTIHITHKQQ